MDKILVVGIMEEHEDLKLVDMTIETFLTEYYGFLSIEENEESDCRKLTDDERFEIEQLLLGNIQVTKNEKTFKVIPKMYFPISEYLENIFVR